MNESDNLPAFSENEDGEGVKEKETSGQWLFRVLKPGGCVIVLIAAIFMILFCFLNKPNRLKNYTPAHSPQEYSASPSLLCDELTDKLFPLLPGEETAVLQDGMIIVTLPHDEFLGSRAEIIKIFPDAPLEFRDSSDK